MLFKIPNFIGMETGGGEGRQNSPYRAESRELRNARDRGEISSEDYEKAAAEIRRKHGIEDDPPGSSGLDEAAAAAATINQVVPPGWLPYGAKRLGEGAAGPALLGAAGLALIGAASLRRSYRTTLRLYTGQFSSKRAAQPLRSPEGSVTQPSPARARPSIGLMQRKLPWVSEHASAIAMAAFRSMTRAPETKLLILSPIILVAVFGSMFVRRAALPSPFIKPLMASGGVAMMLLTMVQLAGNQFGFDRSGFRSLVLAPAERKDILLGKNLAVAPLALGLGGLVILAMQILSPMRPDHFAASLLQMVSMYGVFCIVTNFLSILAPTPVASGSLKPVKPKGITILLQFAFMFVFPIALAPTMIPLGIEFLLQWTGSAAAGLPAYLVLSVVELVAVGLLYPAVLRSQGRLLQSREQRILEVVTVKVE
jgi:hypothetical protein